MRAFVTIGSTKFNSLITEILSSRTLSALKDKGYSTLSIQCGDSSFAHSALVSNGEIASLVLEGVSVEFWKFKPSLREEFERADLIIGHAGSGTMIEILRLPKPLIVVPNSTLLHNHQEELAQALKGQGYLEASTIDNLAETIRTFDKATLIPFPPFDGSKFRQLLDEEMGFM